jgi:hypothetical protein
MHFEIAGGNKLETLKNVVDGCFRVAAQRVLPAFSSITAGKSFLPKRIEKEKEAVQQIHFLFSQRLYRET